MGLGLTGWVTGLSDRYLVNGFLGPNSAGIYTGMYAMFGTPFLPLNGVFVLTLRPLFLRLEAERRTQDLRTNLVRGMLALGVVSLAFGLILYTFKNGLIQHFLTPAYLVGLPAVPGIILGNMIICLQFLLEQSFYIKHRTSLVLLKQGVGSLAAIVIVALFVWRWGLAGAGWACPVYASLELLMGFILVKYLWWPDPKVLTIPNTDPRDHTC